MKIKSFWFGIVWLCLFLTGSNPPLSAQVQSDPSEFLGSIPLFSQAMLSPSGKHLAFITEIDGVSNVLVSEVDVPGNIRRFSFPDSRITALHWHQDDHLIATVEFVTTPKGAPFTQRYSTNYVISTTGKDAPKPMTKFGQFGSTGNADRVVDLDRGDPNHIYITAVMARSAASYRPRLREVVFSRVNLYRYDFGKGEAELFQEGSQSTVRWIMDGNGKSRPASTFPIHVRIWCLFPMEQIFAKSPC